jgi:hypothetical protein
MKLKVGMKGSKSVLQVAGCRLQVAGCRLQVAGYRLQVAGYKIQDTRYRLQDVGYRIQVERCSSQPQLDTRTRNFHSLTCPALQAVAFF